MGSPIIFFGNAAKLLKSVLTIPASTSGTLSIQPAAATTSYTLTAPAAAGTAGQVVYTTDNAGTLGFTTVSGIVATARANRTAAQNFTSGANTVIAWDTLEQESDGGSVTLGASANFTCQTGKDGEYAVGVSARLNAVTASTDYTLSIRVNGSAVRVADPKVNSGSLQAPTLFMATTLTLVAGDVVDFALNQNSGSTLALGAAGENHFYIYKVG